MTIDVVAAVSRAISRRVHQQLGPDVVVVIIFDAAGSHANEDVLAVARSLGMIVLLIPGQLTWLLQMLDVKVFGRLKARLRLDCMRERMRTPDGKMPKHRWASLAVRAVRDLLVGKNVASDF